MQTNSKALKWAVIIGIVIVLNLFFNYGLSLFYPAPNYSNFCPDNVVNSAPATQSACLTVGGQWNETAVPQEKVSSTPASSSGTVAAPARIVTQDVTAYCNVTYTCQKKFDTAQASFEKTIFIALVILGVLAIIVGLFWKTTDAVSVGLSFGGVLSLVIASMRYWSQAQNILRVVILAVALIALLWVGARKFRQ